MSLNETILLAISPTTLTIGFKRNLVAVEKKDKKHNGSLSASQYIDDAINAVVNDNPEFSELNFYGS